MSNSEERLATIKIREKYIYDRLIRDFRTKRHLKEDYDLFMRVNRLLSDSQSSIDWSKWSATGLDSKSIRNGIVKINFYRRALDPIKNNPPIYVINFDTNIWAGEYQAIKREKRLSKILDKKLCTQK